MKQLSLAAMTIATALACAAPLAAQSTARTPTPPAPGWIGFFAGIEQGVSPARPTIVVMAVADGSPAARAGLAAGDTVVALDGAGLTVDGLKALQAGLHAGDRHELTLRSGGQSRTLAIRAERRPVMTPAMPDAPDAPAATVVQARPSLRVQTVTVVSPPMPEVGQPTPFAVHVFGDARTDSINNELRMVEDQLKAARGAEQARARELAARPKPGSRVAASDSTLSRLRARTQMLSAEVAMLRGTLEQIVAERVGSPYSLDGLGQWTLEVTPVVEASPAAPTAPPAPTAVVRPLTPYIAGRDRVAGARLTALNPGLAEYFGTTRGVLVVEVAEGTPAGDAGLRPGDVILRVGSLDVDDLEPVRRAIGNAREDEVPITILRKGVRLTLKLPR